MDKIDNIISIIRLMLLGQIRETEVGWIRRALAVKQNAKSLFGKELVKNNRLEDRDVKGMKILK
jgi:hypothetical protein